MTAFFVPLAHPGHWVASLLYLAPVVLVVVFLLVQTRRERQRAINEPPPET